MDGSKIMQDAPSGQASGQHGTGAPDPGAVADLLRRIAEGSDQAAFRQVFEIYAPRVKSYMLRQGADATTAEELAQETMARVWVKAGMYASDKGNPSTWIYTIARNLRIDKIRRERVWQELPEGHAEQASDQPLPDDLVSENERALHVQEALRTLPPEQLEMITMSYIDGLSHSEIADKLAIPLGTVKSRMRLAYAKLSAQLEWLA